MSLFGRFHGSVVHTRRVRRLAAEIAAVLPGKAAVLDVGSGDGRLAAAVAALRPDVTVRGLDVLVRPGAAIPVEPFDGRHIPLPDAGADVVLVVDVLHHCDDPGAMLAEVARVARRGIVLKDHLLDGFLAGPTLRFMDRAGNARHGVALPYNYWPLAKWEAEFQRLGLKKSSWKKRLGLYPWPASWVFGRGLHFLAYLEPERAGGAEESLAK